MFGRGPKQGGHAAVSEDRFHFVGFWVQNEVTAQELKGRCVLLLPSAAYLQVKELAVSPVDDMGSGVRVRDVDEVHLVGEAQTQKRLH